ncbi:MAG TPA: Crp/Fnr family transcriptional regulator, partial [Burkholderiaceae bacterium]|nr:Crp/Fnr family transcriptional regulator [Burkholderiaceae bacterium]
MGGFPEVTAGVRWVDLLGTPAPTRAECDALDELAQMRRVAAGQAVFTHGEISRSLVVLVSGDVAMGMASPGGAMRTERLVRGTAWLDASSAWLASAHVLDAIALTTVQVVELPRAPLQALLEQRPALARRLLVSLAGEVRRLTVHAHELMHKDAPARLATWLSVHSRPAEDAAANRAVVRLVERKSDIASQLGMTPETLSRLMRSLSDQGVIEVEGYTVKIS